MNLFVFGYGYTSRTFVTAYRSRFSAVSATVRDPGKARRISADGVTGRVFDGDTADPAIATDLADTEAVLVSVPPDAQGDPVLRRFTDAIAAAPRLRWIGYLSTVGVYGDHGGGWVDETTPATPSNQRSVRRKEAEEAWLALGAASDKAVQVFRLAGIYGPGQNALVNLRDGTARRIVKQGQVFNRIHVEDIAGVLMASLETPRAGRIYNVTDDEPAPPQDVVAYAATLLGVPVPPDLPFETAELSPMARSFYGENKRVSNRRLKDELGYTFRYPTYREAVAALHAAGKGRG